MTTNYVRPLLPNKAYDMEYATQFRKEYLYLQSVGIEPSFIKRTGEYRILTYKYTKTPELFRAIADFYENQRNEKQYNEMEKMLTNSASVKKMLSSVTITVPNILQGGAITNA